MLEGVAVSFFSRAGLLTVTDLATGCSVLFNFAATVFLGTASCAFPTFSTFTVTGFNVF